MRPKLKYLFSIAGSLGLLLAVFPFVPRIEQASLVRTDVERIELVDRGDFVGGQFDGGMALGGDPETAVLTLADGGAGTYTSPPLQLTLSASSVAAHWVQQATDDASVSFAVRSGFDGVAWTDWQGIEAEGAMETAGGLKVFGNLVAAGGARYVQFRIDLLAADAESPEVSDIRLFALASSSDPARTQLTISLAARDLALGAIKPLGIVSRKQWGADESLRFDANAGEPRAEVWPEEVRKVEKIVVHHTAGPNVCASAELYCQRQSVVAINDIYYYHAVVNGWGDIGYNSLIGYDGRIYEGRHSAGPGDAPEPLGEAVVAGHALGHNNNTHGVALMGDFQREPVPDIQYDALATTVGWIVKSNLAAAGSIDPLAFSTLARKDGQLTAPLPNIVGHRDVNDTECPGNFLYQRLVELRHLAKRLTEWPPVSVALRAQARGNTIAYHVVVDNHEPELVKNLSIKGAVPANAVFVDSWAGSPYQNRGVFDGSVVTWHDPEARLSPGRDRREYAFIVQPRSGVPRADVKTTAWVEFAEPAHGVAMSDVVSADPPVEVIVDAVAEGRVTWSGDWPVSRNVYGYYGEAYQIHESGDGTSSYVWEADLFEPGLYEVFAWWTAAVDRSTEATFRVFASDGVHAFQANQRTQGARWVSLGAYAFDAGPARVTLKDDSSGVVIADAVRFRLK